MQVKIRFNTDKDKLDQSLAPWRVIIDGVEHLAEKVTIKTVSSTTLDEISPGRFKWHVTTEGQPQWDDLRKEVTIL